MKTLRLLGVGLVALLVFASLAQAQTWTPLVHQPGVLTDTALLLTDGTVMMHEYNSNVWMRLTPDNTGSYVNGTWSALGSMPSTYAPLYFASSILPDGRVLVEGGEYNFLNPIETNLGAIYDPVANSWTAVNPPTGWSTIGDSPATVLGNGKFLIGRNSSKATAAFVPSTLGWTLIGTGKQDNFSEEGMALLPDGTVLVADSALTPKAEKFIPSTQTWVSAGQAPQKLADPGSLEIGPSILRYDGTVFVMGANASGAGHTAIYTPPANPTDPGTWAAGPDFPSGNDMADAPASILPDGNVLCDTSPGIFQSPVKFYEFDGTQFNLVPNPPNPGQTSYQGRMLALPSGQIFFDVADGTNKNVYIYTPNGSANPSWAPTILLAPTTATRGTTVVIGGTQFNGLSQGAAYGDDGGMNTNYPIARITNNSTGHVFYARTHNFSFMGVATGSKKVKANMDVPANAETGASTLEVVANGIASQPVNITIN